MILDTNLLTDIDVTDSHVVGKARETKGMLKEGERVMMFNGARAALLYVKENLNEARHAKSSLDSSGHAGNGFKSYTEAMKTFLEDPSSVVKYDPTELKPLEWHEQGLDLEYDVVGDFIDIGRVLEGVPENYGRLHNGNPRARRVRLVIGLSQVHYMTPQEINHRSERIIRLVDALEGANIRTEITGIDSNGCSHTEVVIKRFDESLVIEDVAVVTNVDFFRRMLFRASEWSDTYSYGYGRPDILRDNLTKLKSQLNDELSVYIDGNMRKDTIDQRFNDLEKMIEQEIGEPVPSLGLIWIDNNKIGNSAIDQVTDEHFERKQGWDLF